MALFGQILVFTVLALVAQIQLVQPKGLTLVQILKLADSEALRSASSADDTGKLDVSTFDLSALQEDDLDLVEIDPSQFYQSCSHGKCEFCTHSKWFKACVVAELLSKEIGFRITVTINGHQVYKKEISAKNPPPLCFGTIPGIKALADVCLEVYDVDLKAKSACVKLTFKVKLIRKKISLKVGCFKLPMEEDAQAVQGLLDGKAQNVQLPIEEKDQAAQRPVQGDNGDSVPSKNTQLSLASLPDVASSPGLGLVFDGPGVELRECSKGKCTFCVKYVVNACIEADAMTSKLGFTLKLTFNGDLIMEKEVAVKDPPPFCLDKTPLEMLKEVCLVAYSLDLKDLSACVRVTLKIKVGPTIQDVGFKISCFKIPTKIDDNIMTEYYHKSVDRYDEDDRKSGENTDKIGILTSDDVLEFISNKKLNS